MRMMLPHDLTKLTAQQVAWCLAYHAALPLAEIRRRQKLTETQIGIAWQQRNDFALNNLRMREEILRQATDRKLSPLEAAALKPRFLGRTRVSGVGGTMKADGRKPSGSRKKKPARSR